MTEPASDDDDSPALSEEQAMTVYHALLKRWFELTLAEATKDIQSLEGIEKFERIVLRARWAKQVELIMATGRAMEKYKTPRGELELVAQIFGSQLGLPGQNFPADIEGRMAWYKNRLANEYERRVKSDVNENKITSPIEQIFLMEWHFLRVNELHRVSIKPQRGLVLDDKTYLIDFMVESADGKVKLAVEIDGHEFHERTRQQAARDRERERTIVRHGYTIFRFTGSEVFRSPRKCVEEVISFITRTAR